MPTVADLLSPATSPSAPAASGAPPAPPAGFVPANDQPPAPPPGFVPLEPKQGSGVLANFAQGALNEGPGFNANLIRDALINPRAITDIPRQMVAKVFGYTAAPGEPSLGSLASLPADIAARKQSQSVVAATPAERIARSVGAGTTGAVLSPEGTVAQLLSGGAAGLGSGVASELLPENLQPVAALVGGVAGYGLAHPSVAAKFGPKVADVVAEVPRDVALTPKGELTEDGREIAAQNGIHPDQVKAAYDHFDEVKANTANDNPDLPPAEAPAMAVGDGLNRAAEEPPANTAPQEAVPGAAASGDGAPPEPPSSAAQRLAEARSEGVDLTKGEATQDFATQQNENTLLNTQGTPESAEARIFKQKQQGQVAEAVDRFKSAFGDPNATAEDRGALIQDAMRTFRDNGKAGVTALYEQLKTIAKSYGDAGSNLIKLDTGGITDKLRELFIDEGVPDQVHKTLRQLAAKYGLIGEDPTTVEGVTTVKLRDDAGNLVAGPKFIGPVEPLTITNAEAFRQKINALYNDDGGAKSTQTLKPIIDDAVAQAVERAAREGAGDLKATALAARKGHQVQLQTFKAGDFVQSLADWKKGVPGVPKIQPDRVLDGLLGGGPDRITTLKKARAIFLSGADVRGKAAWTAVKAHAIGKIFDKAQVLNASADGPIFSGAKLHSAIQAFGPEKLKIILGEEDFNQLMKLNRIMRNATVPIKGTVNPSGSAYTLISFLGKQGMKLEALSHFVPVAGPIARAAVGVVAHGVKGGLQDIKNAKTLKGIREYDLTQAANEDAKTPKVNAADFVQRFIETARDPNIVAPILAASSTQSQKDARQ